MKARIKSGHRYATAVLFSGRIFTKSDWADIPIGMEAQARAIDYLQIQSDEPVVFAPPNEKYIEPLPFPINAVQIDDMVVTETPAPVYAEAEQEEPKPAKRTRKGGKQ